MSAGVHIRAEPVDVLERALYRLLRRSYFEKGGHAAGVRDRARGGKGGGGEGGLCLIACSGQDTKAHAVLDVHTAVLLATQLVVGVHGSVPVGRFW